MTANSWTYLPDTGPGDVDITGYDVEAEDGHVGEVDQASHEPGDSYIVVDTGGWIFDKKRLIPAGKIRQVNPSSEKVFVSLTKSQIEHAPDYDETALADAEYRESVVKHYALIPR